MLPTARLNSTGICRRLAAAVSWVHSGHVGNEFWTPINWPRPLRFRRRAAGASAEAPIVDFVLRRVSILDTLNRTRRLLPRRGSAVEHSALDKLRPSKCMGVQNSTRKQQPTAGDIFIHEFSPGRFELLVEVLFAELSIFTILLILQRGQGGIRPST